MANDSSFVVGVLISSSFIILIIIIAVVFYFYNLIETPVVDAIYGKWSTQDNCDTNCGINKNITWTRTCTPPKNGGKECDSNKTVKITECEYIPCPIDATYNDWITLQKCNDNRKCGTDQNITYFRTCNPPKNNGKPCNPTEMIKTEACKSIHCPIDASYNSWNKTSDCDFNRKCGTDQYISYLRTCNPPKYGGKECNSNEMYKSEACPPIICNTLQNTTFKNPFVLHSP